MTTPKVLVTVFWQLRQVNALFPHKRYNSKGVPWEKMLYAVAGAPKQDLHISLRAQTDNAPDVALQLAGLP